MILYMYIYIYMHRLYELLLDIGEGYHSSNTENCLARPRVPDKGSPRDGVCPIYILYLKLTYLQNQA